MADELIYTGDATINEHELKNTLRIDLDRLSEGGIEVTHKGKTYELDADKIVAYLLRLKKGGNKNAGIES